MSKAVCTDLAFVEPVGCCRERMVFRSVWDRLVHQLFGSIPVGMVAEGQLPDIHIYKNVVLLNEEEPYSFAVVTDDGSAPQPNDVIEYKGKFYVIGAVAQQGQDAPSGSQSNSGPNDQYQGSTEVDAHEQYPGTQQTTQP